MQGDSLEKFPSHFPSPQHVTSRCGDENCVKCVLQEIPLSIRVTEAYGEIKGGGDCGGGGGSGYDGFL